MANGIPALFGQVAKVTNAVSLVYADAQNILGLFAGPQWGIAQNGVFQIVPDSIIGVQFKRDWKLPNYPQEQGAFESYNKVSMPFDAHVRMTKGGTASERQFFLNSVEGAAESLNLYDIVMPDITYSSANIVHFDFQRTSTNGVGLLTVDIWLLEVRVTATESFANTAAPSGAGQVSDGSVQPVTPTNSQSQAITAFT